MINEKNKYLDFLDAKKRKNVDNYKINDTMRKCLISYLQNKCQKGIFDPKVKVYDCKGLAL
jgi:hypothetical protein